MVVNGQKGQGGRDNSIESWLRNILTFVSRPLRRVTEGISKDGEKKSFTLKFDVFLLTLQN